MNLYKDIESMYNANMNPDSNFDKDGNRIIGALPEYVPTSTKKQKPKMSDFLSDDTVKMLVLKAVELAANGDGSMIKFVLEQHFGKAPQSMDLTSDGNPIPLLNGLHNNPSNPETVKAE